MDELFAPPENDWKPVSPKLVTARRLVTAIWGGLLLVAVTLALLVVEVPGIVVALEVIVLLALLAWAFSYDGRSARAIAYAERDEDLYIRHGVMFRKLVVVPYGRMQYVDVNAGPLDQRFGIAKVTLHTASTGTSAVIPGLDADEAARLRDRLTSLGEAQAAGL